MSEVTLRSVQPGDFDALFAQMSDPASVHMAAFTPEDPSDRERFDAHMNRVLADADTTFLAVEDGGALVGSVGCYNLDGHTEVTFWIDRSRWGAGIATRAMRAFLREVPIRPLHARAASDNAGSLRVLARCGFVVIGTEVSFAPARHEQIEETILQLP